MSFCFLHEIEHTPLLGKEEGGGGKEEGGGGKKREEERRGRKRKTEVERTGGGKSCKEKDGGCMCTVCIPVSIISVLGLISCNWYISVVPFPYLLFQHTVSLLF